MKEVVLELCDQLALMCSQCFPREARLAHGNERHWVPFPQGLAHGFAGHQSFDAVTQGFGHSQTGLVMAMPSGT